jgi:hypothetical protein
MSDIANTSSNQSVETSLALLGAKIDYNQAQNSQKLDSMQQLMSINMTHQSGLILNLTTKMEDHEERISTLEGEESEDRGAEKERTHLISAGVGTISGLAVAFITYFFQHLPK